MSDQQHCVARVSLASLIVIRSICYTLNMSLLILKSVLFDSVMLIMTIFIRNYINITNVIYILIYYSI